MAFTTEIVVIGLNHRTASLELRERMAFSRNQAREASAQVRSRGLLKEMVILSTCNRTELYGVPSGRADDCAQDLAEFLLSYHELPAVQVNGALYRYLDRDAVHHIYCVASGLDSMLLGEAEILGQVREAYRAALEQGATGRVLNRLFQSALEVGKRVRSDTQIGAHPMSIAFAGVKMAERIFSPLSERCALILGAGVTSEQVIRHLRDRGIKRLRILNRTEQHAREVASRYKGESRPWDSLPMALEWSDLVVTSVSTPEPVLTHEMLRQAMERRGGRVLMVLDLGVPRNVAPSAALLGKLHLYNIDDLNEIVLQNKEARQKEVPHAEAIVEEHVENFRRWQAGVSACSILKDLCIGPMIDREIFLQKHYEAISHYSARDRLYVMELLKKFLNSGFPDNVNCVRDEPDMWRKLRDLEALCSSFDCDHETK